MPKAMAELMRRGYMAAVTHTDANVGRVLARLAELQMDRNTLVVFTSKSALHSLPPSLHLPKLHRLLKSSTSTQVTMDGTWAR